MSDAANVIPAPFNLGNIWRQFSGVYRANWTKLIACAAMVQIPAIVIQFAYTLLFFPQLQTIQSQSGGNVSPQAYQQMMATLSGLMVSYCIVIIVSLLIPLFTFTIAQGTATYVTAGELLGQPMSLTTALKHSVKAWRRTAVTYLAAILAAIAIGIWTLVPCIGWLTGPGTLFIYSSVFYIAFQVATLEHQGARSLLRGWQMVRRQFWWILGVFIGAGIIFTVFVLVLNGLISVAFNMVTGGSALAPMSPTAPNYIVLMVIQNVILLPIALLYISALMSVFVIVYFDLRTRHEGLDLNKVRETAGFPETALPAPPPEPPGDWITLREGGYFAALSVAFIALYACIYAAIFSIAMVQASTRFP